MASRSALVLPRYRATERPVASGPQRLHRCFFRREAPRVALEFISVAFAIRHFAGSV